MSKTVLVTLSNGKEITFGTEIENVKDIRSRIFSSVTDPWYYFKNSHGEGYFRTDKVISITVK